ncbi:MAG: TIGR01212 family radical SAM protein [Treponema sp.]|nr:TIGR01212 family radical SAM protein [Treponema sp.]
MSDLKYNSYARFLKNKFGCKIKKISIDGGFTCPNKDGTKGKGGCIFCNELSYTPIPSVKDNIVQSIQNQITSDKYRYIAYFQTNTNTYSSKDDLTKKYDSALSASPLIIGLNIGTRCDCFQDYVLDIIAEYAKKTYLTIDIGIESIYDQTLKTINRGHDYNSVVDTLNILNNLKKSRNINFDVCGHIIIGFPWETKNNWILYANEINKLPIDHLKINNLQVVKNTKLAEMYNEKPFNLLSSDEYIEFTANFLSYLSPKIVIQRLTSHCPKDLLLYPKWSISKFNFHEKLYVYMEKNNLFQGSKVEGALR